MRCCCCCCSCFAGLYFYLLVGFSVFCVWRSHSFSFVVFALWANFWLLVGFQICGKSEVRRKLNELAPALGATAASHCPSAFPCCLSVCASFIYLHAVCFSASSPQHFLSFFLLWFCIWRYVFFFFAPSHIFPPVWRFLYGLVVVNQRARTKIKGPRQICLIAYNLWSKRVSAPAHSLWMCVSVFEYCHRNQFECGKG